MGTALSSLRVTADMDTSGYVAAMAAKVAADEAGTESATALGVALAQTDAATQAVVPGVTSLSRQFIQGYGSAAQFESAVRRVGNAMDQGLNGDLAGAILDNIYQKFGLMTDATVLAAQGYVNLVPIIDNLNSHYLTQIDIMQRVTAAQEAAAAAAEYQAQINARLGVANPTTGSAQASAEAFMAQYGGLEGIAAAEAQQIATTFSEDLDSLLIAGVGKSAKDSASVFEEQFSQLDEIARLQAQQAGQYFGEDLDEMLIAGVAKSAKDSAAVFQEQFKQLDEIAQLQAQQAGQNFQNSLNQSFGIGVPVANPASQSASVFMQAEQQAQALENLKQQYDPLYAAQVKFAEAQEQINQLLEQGLFNEEQYAAANLATQEALDKASVSAAGNTKNWGSLSMALQNVGYQMIAFSAGLGPLGMFLAGLGPAGLAAAAGLGIVVSTITSLIDGANNLAEQSRTLEAFSDATGLTIGEIQGLTQAGAQFGIESDTMTRYVQIFTAALGQAQQGTGTLFTALMKINPQLALQVSGAKDVAQGWDIVAQAYEAAASAGNQAGAAAIARAAFGRNGAVSGPLLGASAANGGIIGLAGAAEAAGGTINDTLAKSLQNLQAQIQVTNSRTDVLNESIYGPTVLQGMLAAAQARERVAQALNDMAKANGAQGLLGLTANVITMGDTQGMPLPVPTSLQTATDNLAQGLNSGNASISPQELASWQALEVAMTNANNAAAKTVPTAAALYTAQQQVISALQGTETPAEQLQLKLMQLDKSMQEHIINSDQAAQAEVLLTAAFNITQLQANITAMGALASPTQKYTLAVQQLAQEFNEGKISQAAFNTGLVTANSTLAAAEEQIKETYGIATPLDQFNLKVQQINFALQANILTTSQAAKAQSLLQESFTTTRLEANISAMGALASPTLQYTLAVDQLTLKLNQGTISQYAYAAGLIDAQQKLQTSTESIKEAYGIATPVDVSTEAMTKFNTQMGLIGASAPQVAAGMVAVQKSIQNTADAMAVLQSNTPNFTQLLVDMQNMNKVKDELLTSSGNALVNAAPAFVQALQQGQTISQAIAASLTGAANSIANAFATAGAKNIAGSLSGTIQSLMSSASGGGGVDPSASGGAGGLSSLLSGNFGAGLAQFGLGTGISLITGLIASQNAASQAYEQAQQDWANMAQQVANWSQQMTSGGNGSLTSALASAEQQANQYAQAANKAGQSADQINQALATFADRTIGDFIAGFDTMIGALDSGLGTNSPAEQAAQNVLSVGTQLEGFIEDTETVNNTISSTTSAVNLFSGAVDSLFGKTNEATTATTNAANAVAAAQAASQSYALSLLQTPPKLDDIETSYATLMGTASQLQSVLVDLGMSSDQAATDIQQGVAQAIIGLQTTFTQTLQQQINTAQGNDWINSLQTLEQSSGQSLLDANMLGTDPGLVAQSFQAQAQQIVDSAGLTGAAFQNLITLFPELTGVVTQSTTAVASQISYYQQLQTQITSYLAGLQTGSLSPLSPAGQLSAAQQTWQSQLALAQQGSVSTESTDALNNITSSASTYLQAAQSYYGTGTGYTDAYNQVEQALQQLVPLAEANDPLTQIATNTATTNQILAVLQTLNTSTSTSTTTIAEAITMLGQQSADVANGQASSFFGPMTSYLSEIAANTAQANAPQPAPNNDWNDIVDGDWSKIQLRRGGIVGRFAPGGLVGNGLYNIDSVRARYATGGDIMLAGGEFVTRATSVNSATLAALQHINSTGRLPSNDNSALNTKALVGAFTQAISAGAMAQIGVLKDQMSGLRQDVRALNDTFKSLKRPSRPGIKKAA
jgi:hypothetical protein